MNSRSEENYLKAIWKLTHRDSGAVTTNAIAAEVNTRAASVTDMIKRLSAKKLIHYKKYNGVKLTEKGNKIAVAIVRKHRLWEVFLVDKLGFGWEEVHDIAEQLEHIDSDVLTAKLDQFLGFPKADPHGDPIPDQSGKLDQPVGITVTELTKGQQGIVIGVTEHSKEFLKHLDHLEIKLGDRIEVVQVSGYDQSRLVKLKNKEQLLLTREVAHHIIVKKAQK